VNVQVGVFHCFLTTPKDPTEMLEPSEGNEPPEKSGNSSSSADQQLKVGALSDQ